jgi:hypothetical protein
VLAGALSHELDDAGVLKHGATHGQPAHGPDVPPAPAGARGGPPRRARHPLVRDEIRELAGGSSIEAAPA